MEVKVSVLDRIEQSFVLYKKNFVDFFIPIFIYNLISFLVFGVAFMSFALSSVSTLDVSQMDFFNFLNSPKVVIIVTAGMVLFIVYLLVYIPILLGLIKSIKQAFNGEFVTPKNNIKYGFKNLSNSFKTYWHIFAYVAMIPAVFFIFGGLSFNLGYYIGNDILKQIGLFLMILGGILFLIFSIYRGIKSSFAIYSAVNNDSFTKEDFSNSIIITNNKLLRLIGNFLLIGIIVGFIGSLISGMLGFASYSSIDYTKMSSLEDIKAIFGNFSIIGESLSGFLNTIVSTISSVFVIVFTYLFYISLKNESIIVPQKGNIEL